MTETQKAIEVGINLFKQEYGSDANPLFAFEKGYKYAKNEQLSPLLQFEVLNEWYAWDKTGMVHHKKAVPMEDVFVRREKVVQFLSHLIAGRSKSLERERELEEALREMSEDLKRMCDGYTGYGADTFRSFVEANRLLNNQKS